MNAGAKPQVLLGLEDIAHAEKRLLDSLSSPSDGYLARWDRKISIRLSKKLLRWPITPNHITTMSLGLGLVSAYGLASTNYTQQLLGVFGLWFCNILDGCDGEIARLKHLGSKLGARYDLIADHITHAATFMAIAAHVQGKNPDASFLWLSVALLSGILLSMFWVWRLILCKDPQERDKTQQFYERIASRDYIYLILLLTAIGRLHWFLWAAAIGSHIYWASLVLFYANWIPRSAIFSRTLGLIKARSSKTV